MQRFEQDLKTLKRRVLEMGRLAESMLSESWLGFATVDRTRLDRALDGEPRLDRFQVEIDHEAVRLIAIYAPVARDLRVLLMIARITSELERIGDQAVDNCEYATLVGGTPPPGGRLPALAALVIAMVKDALQAFEDEDPQKAQLVMRLDDRVDTLYSQVFHDLLDRAPDEAGSRAASTALILMARSLERIADHATNICEEVFYMVEGADIRHRTADGSAAV